MLSVNDMMFSLSFLSLDVCDSYDFNIFPVLFIVAASFMFFLFFLTMSRLSETESLTYYSIFGEAIEKPPLV